MASFVTEDWSKRLAHTAPELTTAFRTFIVTGVDSHHNAIEACAKPEFQYHPVFKDFERRASLPCQKGKLFEVNVVYARQPIVWEYEKDTIGPKFEVVRWTVIELAPEIFPQTSYDLTAAQMFQNK